jgi:hypothetical protein
MALITKYPGVDAPLTQAWKFFQGEHLDAIMYRGSVRIGTAACYREQDGFNDGRSDPYELVTQWQPGAVTLGSDHPALQSILPVPHGMSVDVAFSAGTVMMHAADAYLLCFSEEPDDTLCAGMLEKFGYDMFYHIPDIEAYLAALADTEDSRLADGLCCRVQYDAPHTPQPEWAPTVFRKRPAYSWQNEIRSVWRPSGPLMPFTIEVPAICPMIRVYTNPAAQGSQSR